MKKHVFIVTLILTAVLCLTLAGCSEQTEYDKYKAQGYTVSVTYDGNGGAFLEREGISIVDVFNPSDYVADSDGMVHIKLMEPTDSRRPSGSSDPLTLIKQNYFFAGWYENRVFKRNEADEVVDWNGNALIETDGVYYLKDAENETVGYPACSSYSGLWDFSSDTVDAKVGEEVEKTLYAGWVPYYEFEYYYKVNGEAGDWTKYATTSFDYKSTNKEGSTTSDRDTLFIPSYSGGAMNYVTNYADGRSYRFPSLDGYTFASAYSDENCENEIVDSFEHEGTLDVTTGIASDRIQKIYVLFDKGNVYRISTAEELSQNGDSSGIYYINDDLDFDEVTWPATFMYNDFSGEIHGNGHVIKNVYASFTSTSSSIGGLFGSISGAVKDVTFDNITVDYVTTGFISECNFGLFTGNVSETAELNVTIKGECNLKFGKISLNTEVGGDDIVITLPTDDTSKGVILEATQVKVVIYGIEKFGSEPKEYDYTIDIKTVEREGNRLKFQVVAFIDPDQEPSYEFNYKIGG